MQVPFVEKAFLSQRSKKSADCICMSNSGLYSVITDLYFYPYTYIVLLTFVLLI